MSEMYIWSQKLGRVCYGITLAIICLPTWSSGTMPKCRFLYVSLQNNMPFKPDSSAVYTY